MPASSRACAGSTATVARCSRCAPCGCSATASWPSSSCCTSWRSASTRSRCRPAPDADPRRRRDRLAVAHDPGRPHRPPARPARRVAAAACVAGLVFVADGLAVRCSSSRRIIGVISPSGDEVGPFLAVEQAALSQIVRPTRRTATFAWYHLVGLARDRGRRAGARASVSQLATRRAASPMPTRTGSSSSATRSIGLVDGRGRCSCGSGRRSRCRRADRPGRDHPDRVSGCIARAASCSSLSAAVRARCLRRRLRLPEPHRATGSTSGSGVDPAALGLLLFGANVLAGAVGARRGRARRPDRARSTRWCSPTCPSNVLLLLVPADADLRAGRRSSCSSASPSARWTCPRASRTRWPSWIPTSAPRRPA